MKWYASVSLVLPLFHAGLVCLHFAGMALTFMIELNSTNLDSLPPPYPPLSKTRTLNYDLI